ncbi:hypothetical protein KM043_000941 [Ampulex compressa]|nr:hypothetical protein KM043_000941 [Ampulex compressa]
MDLAPHGGRGGSVLKGKKVGFSADRPAGSKGEEAKSWEELLSPLHEDRRERERGFRRRTAANSGSWLIREQPPSAHLRLLGEGARLLDIRGSNYVGARDRAEQRRPRGAPS